MASIKNKPKRLNYDLYLTLLGSGAAGGVDSSVKLTIDFTGAATSANSNSISIFATGYGIETATAFFFSFEILLGEEAGGKSGGEVGGKPPFPLSELS